MKDQEQTRFEIVSQILKMLAIQIEPGITGKEIEARAEEYIEHYGVKSYNKGYKPQWAPTPFPSVLCISMNQMIAHGIPLDMQFLEGDIVNLDIGIVDKNGYCADAALTVPVGKLSNKHERLLRYAKKALYVGIQKLRPENTVEDVARTIERYANQNGYVVNKNFCGHGIGREMHVKPQVMHGVIDKPEIEWDRHFVPGEIICLEPMLTYKDPFGLKVDNGWTFVTADGQYSAMFEHMVQITDGDPVILTEHISN